MVEKVNKFLNNVWLKYLDLDYRKNIASLFLWDRWFWLRPSNPSGIRIAAHSEVIPFLCKALK